MALKFALLLALTAYSGVVIASRPLAARSAGALALVALGASVIAAYAYSGATWPGFGACFSTIGLLLVVQGVLGTIAGAPRALAAPGRVSC
jgi:hypothetical protein